MASVQQIGEASWSVLCAACCHMALVFAVMHFFLLLLLLLSITFDVVFLNLVLINRRNGPRCQRVLALGAFFNRDNTEGTNSLKFLCLMFGHVLFHVNLCWG